MASGLALWEVDPFFSAAEDVQQSADRMESTYRTWLHSKAVAEENLAELKTAELSKRELLTSLDTAKWQLEEFEKAVTEASQIDGFQMAEEAPKRHFCFIEAIQNQICLVENAVQNSLEANFSKSLHSINLDDEERDQLAMFLSGCTAIDTDALNDGRIHPIEESDIGEISPGYSEIAESKDSRSEMWESGSGKHYSMNGHDGLSHLNGFVEKDFGAGRKTCEEIVEADDSGLQKGLNGKNLSEQSDWQGDAWDCSPDEEVGSNNDYLNKPERISRLINGLSSENFLTETKQIDKFQTSRNGFKRWKDGDQGFDIREEILMDVDANGSLVDIEAGAFVGASRSNRKNPHGVVASAVSVGEKQPSELRKRTKQQSLHSLYLAAFSPSGQRASATVIVLGLVGTYFWFLSSLVPYMSTMVPDNFQD